MGKYEEEFLQNQIEEWKDKYITYSSFKQKIKQYIIDMTNKSISEISQIEKNEILAKYIKEFTGELDKEIRKIYVFFSKNEKHLYKSINKYLHIKEDFESYGLDDYLTQYSELKDLSLTSLNMSKYVYYNLKTLIKILDKFDKKVIGNKDKDFQIKNNYIISKLEDPNSDILYLINFKMLDEVNVIIEDLIKCLKDNFKLNKNKFKNSVINLNDNEADNQKNEALMENKIFNSDDVSVIIDSLHKGIKDNLKDIDITFTNIAKLFVPWKEFLRISGDVSSRLIQLSKELRSFSEGGGNSDDNFNNIFKNKKSIVDNISFSKQNSFNIYITLFHGFLYMFSFANIIPSYSSLIQSNKFWKESYDNRTEKFSFYCMILMSMAPLGAIISYIYESALFKRTTKVPLIMSCIGLFLGNLLYSIGIHIEPFYLIFIGRFLIGSFNLRTHNKMYLLNFLLRKDVSYYLTLFHTFSLLGLACGFLINTFNILYQDHDDLFINQYNLGSFLGVIFSLILLIISLKCFTEARSSNFNMTSMRSFSSVDSVSEKSNYILGESNIDKEPPLRISVINGGGDINNNIIMNEESINEEFTEDMRRKTLMVNDINDQLGDFNRQSNFNDTNLVSLSISQLTFQEREGLQYLFKSFFVYLFIVFTTKFITETIFINLPLFIKKHNDENDNKIDNWIVPLVLGCSCLLVLVIEFCLKDKNKYITEKTLLIISFILNLIINFILVFLHKKYNVFYFIIISLSLIFSNIIEKYATHFFNYIIPQNYIICKIQGNIFINVISMISRIIASALIICFSFENYDIIIYILNIVFSLICTVLFLVFYSDIRIKSISRIMNKIGKDEVKVATEI